MQRNLADIFEIVVDAVPDREALVAGDRRLTYAALDERANRLADHLAGAGIGPGDHVAAYLYNGTEFVETMLAAFKLRAAVVNVNYRYVATELAYLLPTPTPRRSSTTPGSRRRWPRSRRICRSSALGWRRRASYEEALAGASPARPEIARTGDDLYLLYTGGTTGMPKGVMWRHDDILGRRPRRPRRRHDAGGAERTGPGGQRPPLAAPVH